MDGLVDEPDVRMGGWVDGWAPGGQGIWKEMPGVCVDVYVYV